MFFILHWFVTEEQENEIVIEGSSVVHSEPSHDGNVPPKVDSKAEVLDEKVSKQIIKEGHGSKPSKYSTCFCKYSQLFCWSNNYIEMCPLDVIID